MPKRKLVGKYVVGQTLGEGSFANGEPPPPPEGDEEEDEEEEEEDDDEEEHERISRVVRTDSPALSSSPSAAASEAAAAAAAAALAAITASPSKSLKVVGNFVILRRIGEGTNAEVCVAQNRETEEIVAAKIIDIRSLEARGMHDILEQSRREAAIMKKLHHRNIVDYKAALFAKNEGKLYLIMEYCSGGELFSRIENGVAMSEDIARKYFQDIVFGLEYVHSCGICHRDLKLENVLLDADDNAKICDFGFAKTQTDGTLLATPCGSRVYAAPEVVDHLVQYDGMKADVFSLGVILFAMVTARMPYATQREAVEKRLRWPRHVELSAGVKDLISGMLEPDPARRFSLHDVIGQSWFRTNLDKRPDYRPPFRPEDVVPTEQEMAEAFTQAKVDIERTLASARGSASSYRPGEVTYVDAFTLASLLTKGTMDSVLLPHSKLSGVINTSTQFTCSLDAPVALDRVCAELTSLGMGIDAPRPASFGFKVRAHGEDGVGNLCVMVVHFIPALESLTFVTLRRRRGNVIFFNRLYHELTVKLGESVTSQAPSLGSSAAADAGEAAGSSAAAAE